MARSYALQILILFAPLAVRPPQMLRQLYKLKN